MGLGISLIVETFSSERSSSLAETVLEACVLWDKSEFYDNLTWIFSLYEIKLDLLYLYLSWHHFEETKLRRTCRYSGPIATMFLQSIS